MGRAINVFGHMQTAQAKFSLCVRAVWSGLSLSANRITGYYKMYEWRSEALIVLCACAWWTEHAHFVPMFQHTFFAWRGTYNGEHFVSVLYSIVEVMLLQIMLHVAAVRLRHSLQSFVARLQDAKIKLLNTSMDRVYSVPDWTWCICMLI